MDKKLSKLNLRKAVMNNQQSASKAMRRARTRTLIMLGGLIERTGLLEGLGIKLGADLQKDFTMQKPTAALFWGLLELKKFVRSEEFHLDLWAQKGLRAYAWSGHEQKTMNNNLRKLDED